MQRRSHRHDSNVGEKIPLCVYELSLPPIVTLFVISIQSYGFTFLLHPGDV